MSKTREGAVNCLSRVQGFGWMITEADTKKEKPDMTWSPWKRETF